MRIPANVLQGLAGWLVSNVEAILIMCTPLLSALPSMFAAIRALEKGGWKQANLIGGIIEALGLTSGAFMGYIEGHNQRHPEQPISRWWGYGVFVFYLIVVEALIIAHTPDPVSILLPGLTVIGSVIVGFRRLMLRADEKQGAKDKTVEQRDEARFQFDMEMKRRGAEQRLEIERAEVEQRLAIERQKVDAKLSKGVAGSVAKGVAGSVAAPPQSKPPTLENGDATQRRNTLLGLLQQHGDVGDTAFGNMLDVDRTTVYRDLKAMEKAGIVHKNGHGWEPTS